MKKKISLKFIIPIAIGLIAISVAITWAISASKVSALNESVNDKMQSTKSEVDVSFDFVYKGILKQVMGSMNIFIDKSQNLGTASLSNGIKVANKTVPQLYFGTSPQALNFGLVDYLKTL